MGDSNSWEPASGYKIVCTIIRITSDSIAVLLRISGEDGAAAPPDVFAVLTVDRRGYVFGSSQVLAGLRPTQNAAGEAPTDAAAAAGILQADAITVEHLTAETTYTIRALAVRVAAAGKTGASASDLAGRVTTGWSEPLAITTKSIVQDLADTRAAERSHAESLQRTRVHVCALEAQAAETARQLRRAEESAAGRIAAGDALKKARAEAEHAARRLREEEEARVRQVNAVEQQLAQARQESHAAVEQAKGKIQAAVDEAARCAEEVRSLDQRLLAAVRARDESDAAAAEAQLKAGAAEAAAARTASEISDLTRTRNALLSELALKNEELKREKARSVAIAAAASALDARKPSAAFADAGVARDDPVNGASLTSSPGRHSRASSASSVSVDTHTHTHEGHTDGDAPVKTGATASDGALESEKPVATPTASSWSWSCCRRPAKAKTV